MYSHLFRQWFPSIETGILTLWPSAGSWNSPYRKSAAKATQLILTAEDVTAGVRGQDVPQSLQKALVDHFKAVGLVSTRDWPPWLVKSKQNSQQKKKKKVFSDSKDSVHLPLPSFVQNNFPILIASWVATDSLYN